MVIAAFALVTAAIVIPVSTVYAATCDNSARYVWDDGTCGYIHPDDRVFAILNRLTDLEQQIESLHTQLALMISLLFIIAVAALAIAVKYLLQTSATKSADNETREGVSS
jgi:hypothetical protein